MRIQPVHVLVLVVVAIVLFGANRLPSVARSVGESLRIFKNEVKDLTSEAPATSAGEEPNATGGAAAPRL